MIVPDYTLHEEPLALSFEVVRIESDSIKIERVRQRDGDYKWAVRNGFRECLSTMGEWDYESMPSNRPEDWIATHRFTHFEDAVNAAKEAARLAVEDYLDRVRRANESGE